MPPNFPHGMPPGFMTHPPHMGMPPMPPMGFPHNMPPPGFMQPPPTSMQQQENAPPPPMPPSSDGSVSRDFTRTMFFNFCSRGTDVSHDIFEHGFFSNVYLLPFRRQCHQDK